MAKEKKIKKIVSCQAFSPIRDVKDGIIITKKNHFVKLMEFTPINFSLRSASEKNLIIGQYQAVIRSMPDTVQFKITSRRANVDTFLRKIASEMESEPHEGVRDLMQEQMEMIAETGARQGVSRRFFVAFPYESTSGLSRSPSFRQIRDTLERQGEGISNALALLGNDVISKEKDDTYILSTLYNIMSRKQSEQIPFETRQLEVIARYADSEFIDFINNPNIQLPVNDFIAPQYIDAQMSPSYIVVDDLYYMFCYLPSNAYPVKAVAGWMSVLIGLGEGIDVDFWIHKEDTAKVQSRLQFRLRSNKVKLRNTEDTSQDYDDLKNAVESAFYIKEQLAAGDELAYMATMLTITARSLKELNYKYAEVKRICVQCDMRIKQCLFQQADAFKASLPICEYDPNIFRKSRRNILTSDLASSYPFVSSEMTDENGVLMGFDSANNSLVFLDIFDTNKYDNANVVIMGSSGAGKTYTLETFAMRMREKKIQVFIIAPLKGWEFERACTAVGGSYIKIAPGSGQNINIMAIRKKDANANLVNGGGKSSGSILMEKIQQLHIFFSLLVPDITYEERQILDEALLKTYDKFGITNKNKSLIDPADPEKYRKMPVLGDLHSELKRYGDVAKRLYQILTRYVSGSAASFNAQTNINLDNLYVVLDVSTLTKEMLPVGMFIALDCIWDKVKEDISSKKVIAIDEAWRLIGPGASKQAADFVLEIFKTIRGMGGSALAATQNLKDFFALDNGSYGSGIINNSQINLLMKTKPSEAAVVAETMELTEAEFDRIKTMQKGTCLLAANKNHIFINIKATPSEHDLITTDQNDLRRIARKNAGMRPN